MVKVARSDKGKLFGDLTCEAANNVAVDMTYNLGIYGMSLFKKFIGHMKNGDYVSASFEGEDSRWCTQVPNRCLKLMRILREYC